MSIVYVAIGGAFGSVMRYLMGVLAGRQLGIVFPYGTMIINITGSFLMGVVIGLLTRFAPAHSQDIRLFVAVGILGGYTTFSSFSLDAITLLEEGRISDMMIYILASVIGSLLALFAGLLIIRSIPA